MGIKKVAYITGGSKGIGLGIAMSLVRDNYHVYITGRSESSLKSAIQGFGDDKEFVTGIPCDVRSLDGQEKAIQQILDEQGRLDVVIANAGVGHFTPIDKMTPGQWHEMIDINLTGVFNSIKASVEALKLSKGYFITIASLAGTNFFAKGSGYNASKFGLVGFTQSVMLDLRQHDIKVTTIMPGSVATFFNNNTPSEKDDWKIQIEDLGQIVSDILKMHPRTLPSKIEVRPSKPPVK